jgi:hypothetical protein
MNPKKLTEDQIFNAVSQAIKDVVSFIESKIAPDHIDCYSTPAPLPMMVQFALVSS